MNENTAVARGRGRTWDDEKGMMTSKRQDDSRRVSTKQTRLARETIPGSQQSTSYNDDPRMTIDGYIPYQRAR